jgi:hypothetical protein
MRVNRIDGMERFELLPCHAGDRLVPVHDRNGGEFPVEDDGPYRAAVQFLNNLLEGFHRAYSGKGYLAGVIESTLVPPRTEYLKTPVPGMFSTCYH